MHRLLMAVAMLPVFAGTTPVLADAPSIDSRTDLALDCGAAYFLNAAYQKDKTKAAQIKTAGTEFMTWAGNVLAAQGMSDAELEALGRDRTLAMAAKMKTKAPLDFSADDCQALLAEIRAGSARPAEPTEAALPEAPPVSSKADKLLSCAAAYLVASSGAGGDTKAKSLKQIATTIGGLADKELEADGFTGNQIETVGKQYGMRIARLITAGKDLPYSWDECAKLAF